VTEEEDGEEEEEPNFDEEFDGEETLSNCSSWASGISQDKPDR
jgi:hypothetical protein